jgi:putative DNA primase/helicase
LKVPAITLNTTDEYRSEMNIIGNFLKACRVQRDGVTIRIRELFKAYQDWCEESNEHACSERFLSLGLKKLSFEKGGLPRPGFGAAWGYYPMFNFNEPKELACAREVLLP